MTDRPAPLSLACLFVLLAAGLAATTQWRMPVVTSLGDADAVIASRYFLSPDTRTPDAPADEASPDAPCTCPESPKAAPGDALPRPNEAVAAASAASLDALIAGRLPPMPSLDASRSRTVVLRRRTRRSHDVQVDRATPRGPLSSSVATSSKSSDASTSPTASADRDTVPSRAARVAPVTTAETVTVSPCTERSRIRDERSTSSPRSRASRSSRTRSEPASSYHSRTHVGMQAAHDA